MSQSRLQNSLSHEPSEDQNSQIQSDVESLHNHNQTRTRPPGRPRGRGRPKMNQKIINKKKTSQQQPEEEPPRPKERVNIHKEENQIQPYIRIVDYLKKIQSDEASFQNKMNPYHSLTATCFWYMVSAQYYSYDFFVRNNPLEAANQVLNRISRLPLPMPTRITKIIGQGTPLEFQTQEVKKHGQEISEYLSHLIPNPLTSNKIENIQKKPALTTVTEDNQFISSTRSILFNYIKNKIQKSQKWSSILKGRLQVLNNLQPKQFTRDGPIKLEENKSEIMDASQLDILSRQVKRRKSQKKKNQTIPDQVTANGLLTEQKIQEDNQSHQKSPNQNQQQKMQIQQNLMQEQKEQSNKKELDSGDAVAKQENNQIEAEEDQDCETQEQKKFLKQMTSDEVLLSSILNLPLDKVISILESTIPKVQLPAIYQPFMPIPKSDPLQFVYQLHQDEQRYLQYMKEFKKKMYQSKIKRGQITSEDQEKQTQFQDAKCQICTDGDYTDDNLIVFCSTCNISLHQRCVGLAKVPAQSWVCDVCLAFGPAGINLPCPLCNVKGGAMKRTNIHIDSNLWKETNPGYYQYSKRCPYNKQKEQYIQSEKIAQQQKQNQNTEQKQELYYDYFNKATYPQDQPSCHYVWVHYVCSIWVPQCYFEQKNGAINVRGIQNIEKKRYKHECFVCKKSKAGACVKCQDPECRKYYHPQCARKKKVYMQQLNLQKIKYLIFCEEHQPLKITRQIQYKKKKNRDEIIKFARMIQKYIQTYKIAIFPYRLQKIIPTKSFIQTFEHQEKQEQEQKKPQVIQQTDEDFIKQIIIKLSKVKKISVTVVKTENGLKITEVNQPSRRQMRKCLNKYDDFWHTIQNGQTAQENCKRYDRIIKQNTFLKDKMEIFLNGGSLAGSAKQLKAAQKSKKGKNKSKKEKEQVQTLIEQEGGIFCICRKPYENQLDMIQCQICGQWYHYKCIGFIGTQVDAQTLEFHCMKCMKFQSQEEKKPRLEKCIHLFATDSLYLNYSPPTPKLMSQENSSQLKQDLRLEQQIPKQTPNQKSEKDIDQIQNKPTHDKAFAEQEIKISQYPVPKIKIKTDNSIKFDDEQQHNKKSDQSKQIQNGGPKSNSLISVSTKQQNKMQSTITQFLMKSKKQHTSSLKGVSPNSNCQLSVKEQLAQLQKSVTNKEYNSFKK